MSTNPTYVYKHYSRNFIVGLDLLERVKPLKVESWRFANERSEDAVSWNVFLGSRGLGALRAAFQFSG